MPIERVLRFLRPLEQRWPGAGPGVRHMLAIEQLPRLGRGDLDFAVFHYARERDRIEMEPLFEGESLARFLAKDHRLAGKPIVTAQDLRGEVHLTWGRDHNPALYNQLMTRVVRADYRLRDVIQVGHDSSRDLLLAAADRRGVAFGVASFDPDSGDAGIVAHRPVDPPLRMPDTVVAWRGFPRPRGDPRSLPRERSRDSSTRPAAAWIQTQGVSMHTPRRYWTGPAGSG